MPLEGFLITLGIRMPFAFACYQPLAVELRLSPFSLPFLGALPAHFMHLGGEKLATSYTLSAIS